MVVHMGGGFVLLQDDFSHVIDWFDKLVKSTIDRQPQKEHNKQLNQMAQLLRYSFWPADSMKLANFAANRRQLFHEVRYDLVCGKSLQKYIFIRYN